MPGRHHRTPTQGIASRVVAPQHIAGRRPGGGIARGDVPGGHGRDQRAADGVDHPPAAGGARPAGPRPGPAGRHPGRAAGATTRQAVRRPLPGSRDRAAPAPAVRDPGERRCRGGRQRPRRGGRGRAAPPARQRPVVFRTPAAEPSVDRTPSARPPVARPAPRPVRPPQRPEHGSPPRSWRRGAKPHPGRHDRDRAPSAPRPDRPRAADLNGKPGGESSCPGRSYPEARTDRYHSRDTDSRRWVGPQDNAGGAEHQREPRRHEPGRDENQPDRRSRDEDRPGGGPPSQERQDQERQAEDPPGRHADRRDHDPREQRSAPTGHRDHDKRGTGR